MQNNMIKFERFSKDKLIGLLITGHAGYAPKGSDIVCAGISAIVQTAAIGCRNYDPKTEITSQNGGFVFVCKDKPITRAIIKTAILGLEQMKEQYPTCFDSVDVLMKSS
jgi:uncharacterized protein